VALISGSGESAPPFRELTTRNRNDLSAQTTCAAAARILIYCNNNFQNAEGPFPSKAPIASLNISTFISLYDYGYRNIYELGPRIDPKKSKLPLVPTKK
jgi:hypothetical protein